MTPTPTYTPTHTPTPTATATPTATPTSTPTATSTPLSFPYTGILDTFNRSNNNDIGANWSGSKSSYRIRTNKLDVLADGDIYWSASQFGTSQEVYVKLSTIDSAASQLGLLLKSQSSTGWGSGVLEVYKNGVMIGTRDVCSWAYYNDSGYIGLRTLGGPSTYYDDFGGGSLPVAYQPLTGGKVLASYLPPQPVMKPAPVGERGQRPHLARIDKFGVYTERSRSAMLLTRPAGVIWRSYYYAGSTRIAMREDSDQGSEVYYLLTDHLGSTAITYRPSDGQTSRQWFTPWGETRQGSSVTATDYSFTGQRTHSLGMLWYSSRFYDPYLNRWVQPDRIIPGGSCVYSPLVVDYHETKFLEQVNQENRKQVEDPQVKSSNVPINPIAFDRFSYANNDPLRYTDPDGHFAFLVPLLAGALIGGGISTVAYLIATKASGQDPTWAGAAGAAAGGVVAGMVSVIATPVAGTLLHAVGISATGTALVAGTAAVNAAGGAASYLAGGYTQNAVDTSLGNTPTFEPTVGGALFNAGIAGALSPAVGYKWPVANNTMSTLSQASYFMPGRTVVTLIATQNSRNLYSQAFISVGVGAYAGFQYVDE